MILDDIQRPFGSSRMVSGGSESERQLRGISTLNALRADGAITSFRVKAPHKSRWAFIVRLLRGAFIIVLVQCDVANRLLCPDLILARPTRTSGSGQSIICCCVVIGGFFLRLQMGSFQLGRGEQLQCWRNVALLHDLAIHGRLCLSFEGSSSRLCRQLRSRTAC